MGKLIIKNICKNYGEKRALNNFSVEVNGGEIVGLIGRNGAGKTTLMNIIAGNIFSDSGEVFFDEKNVSKDCDIRKDFGILIEPAFLDYMNTEDNLRLLQNVLGERNRKKIKAQTKEVLDIVGLSGKEKTYVKLFSFGMKQRLGFAQALLNGKKLMILDEPFVGLDIKGRDMVKHYVKQYARDNDVAVIFSDHNLDEVRSLCDRVVVIADGEKKYDGEVYSRKRYEIKVRGVSDMLVKSLKSLRDSEVQIKENTILINKKDHINSVINFVTKDTEIVDINIIDDSLERFF